MRTIFISSVLTLSSVVALADTGPVLTITNKTASPFIVMATSYIKGLNIRSGKTYDAYWLNASSGANEVMIQGAQPYNMGPVKYKDGDFSGTLSSDAVDRLYFEYYTPDVAGSTCPINKTAANPCVCYIPVNEIPVAGTVYANDTTYHVVITNHGGCSVTV
jgi:hypothetical protein